MDALLGLCILSTLRTNASCSSTDSRGALIYAWHHTLTLAPGLVSCHKQYTAHSPQAFWRGSKCHRSFPSRFFSLQGSLFLYQKCPQPMTHTRLSFSLKETTRTLL